MDNCHYISFILLFCVLLIVCINNILFLLLRKWEHIAQMPVQEFIQFRGIIPGISKHVQNAKIIHCDKRKEIKQEAHGPHSSPENTVQINKHI